MTSTATDVVVDRPVIIAAGPCAVESQDQMHRTALHLSSRGFKWMRGGAFKPRTSPDSFQGLGIEGLRIFRTVADQFDMHVVSEVLDVRDLDVAAGLIDVIQIGARNMQNYELLRAAGKMGRYVLLKRGLAATTYEWFKAADYVSKGGAHIILCERGHRTYMDHVRFMLDVAAIYEAREQGFVVWVDPSHPAGNTRYVTPLALAGLAAGASGVLVEMHPFPSIALSDAKQQLTFEQFDRFVASIQKVGYDAQ